jgi:hypothetical protein
MNKRRILFALLSLLTSGLLFLGSVPAFAAGNGAGRPTLKEAREALEQRLVSLPGFAGIAHSEEDGTIVVFLENEAAKGNVPDSVGGFKVRKEVTGPFKALGVATLESPVSGQVSYDVNRQGPFRPLVGGVSVSAYAGKRYIYAGTLGMVTYGSGSAKKILSNAHVLAMNPDNNAFLPTDGTTPIIQPGSLDGGKTLLNRVGALDNYIPIKFSKIGVRVDNYADAAIASIDDPNSPTSGVELNNDGSHYQVSGTTTVAESDQVRKSGRTTGVTTGTVKSTNFAGWVDYGSGKRAYFVDQITVAQPFLEGGDSGSAVDLDGKFVGLAFAGSSSYAIVCKASYIIDGLHISVAPATPTP